MWSGLPDAGADLPIPCKKWYSNLTLQREYLLVLVMSAQLSGKGVVKMIRHGQVARYYEELLDGKSDGRTPMMLVANKKKHKRRLFGDDSHILGLNAHSQAELLAANEAAAEIVSAARPSSSSDVAAGMAQDEIHDLRLVQPTLHTQDSRFKIAKESRGQAGIKADVET